MERILQASAELLAEVGVDSFNTNLLADRAGLGVRAIYRYFPNKVAIILALSDQMRETERAWVGDLREMATVSDWRLVVGRAIDGFYDAASAYQGYAALRAASRAIPELRDVDHPEDQALRNDLAEGLAGLGLDLEPDHLDALCRTIIETGAHMLDLALQRPPAEARLLVREIKRMIVALLESYLGTRAGVARPPAVGAHA